MNQEYLSIEDAKKLANYDKLLAENTMLKSDNKLLKETIKDKDKKYLKIIEEKNKEIKNLKERLSSLEYKQVDMFNEI